MTHSSCPFINSAIFLTEVKRNEYERDSRRRIYRQRKRPDRGPVSHYHSLWATLNLRADHISRFMGGKLKPARFVRASDRSLALVATYFAPTNNALASRQSPWDSMNK